MSAPDKIHDLVELFERNADTYRSPHYNEAAVRQEFINPFFKCLGWDMDNERGYDEAHKQVIHEAAIKVGGVTKAPDYCFRIGGTREFFLEAKKPAVNIEQEPGPAYQLRRYAWNEKLPLSILTNFDRFVVYDCRSKPDQSDSPAAGRFLHLTYREYADRWDEIAGNFSPEAINQGALKKFAESKKRKGTLTVDEAFLKEIECWRVLLAKNLALRNPQLTQRELNFAVQVTIDRIIFLRMCEDRGIEPLRQLMALLNGTAIYGRLLKHFRDADDRYNSGLFHFHKEKDRDEDPDELTPGLVIDDKILKDIFGGLYEPYCPYEFSVLPAEILGHVYEQFLGKVIRLTAGHRAQVEDKPEVKKAGGVYYTPTYIVDYIVKHTVGKLLEGKAPRQAGKLTILDPACGSGSFLLGAYQYLLDWHREWYVNDGPEKHRKELYEGRGGVWRLTTAEKKRILVANIYGVDIDPQAVEVTKLSLLLKVLEGESQETLETQRRFFHERALPDLASNIKCGNSLIGPDFYEGRQQEMFDEDERYRINVFDWNAKFPKIMKAGGFDAVIGNPPWISAWTGEDKIRLYLTSNLKYLTGHWDLYLAFLIRTFRLLSDSGRHSFVFPSSILTEPYAKDVRAMLVDSRLISAIAIFGAERVFAKVSRKVCILVLSSRSSDPRLDIFEDGKIIRSSRIDPIVWASNHNCTFSVEASEGVTPIRENIQAQSIKVGNVYYVNYGAQISSKVKGAFEVRPWRWTSMLVNTGLPRETFLCHAHDVLFLLSSRHKPFLIF